MLFVSKFSALSSVCWSRKNFTSLSLLPWPIFVQTQQKKPKHWFQGLQLFWVTISDYRNMVSYITVKWLDNVLRFASHVYVYSFNSSVLWLTVCHEACMVMSYVSLKLLPGLFKRMTITFVNFCWDKITY